MTGMSRRDTALACVVAVLWGVNFVAIHASLEQFPPFFLASLRFALLAVPALLFVKRPQVPVRWLVLYGVGFGILQFVFLYAGMAAGMPAGLASLVLQASAPFTVLLAALFLKERPGAVRLTGIAIAVTGFTVIAVTRGLQAQLVPVLLVLAGAMGWAIGNIGAREARPSQPFAFMMWMTVIPPVPLLLLSLVVEGPARIESSLSTSFTTAALPAWVGLAYTVLISTVIGTSLWSLLMSRNPSSSVAPFSMLVPVAGFLSAGILLGERPGLHAYVGMAVTIAGVALISRAPQRGKHPAHARRAVLLAALTALAWGFMLLIYGTTGQQSPVWAVFSTRVASAVVLAGYLLLSGRGLSLRGQNVPVLAAIGLLLAAANFLFIIATGLGYLSVISILGSLSPVVVTAYAQLLLHERLAPRQWAAFAAVFVGIALLSL